MNKWKDETLDIEYRTAWFMWDYDFWSFEDVLPIDIETLEENIEYVADLHRVDIADANKEFTEYLTEIADTLDDENRAAAMKMIALVKQAA